MASDEILREALVDLAKAREFEARQRRESEALLAGLRVLIKPMESSRMFKELLEVMQKVLDFAGAFVLQSRPDGSLLATVATDDLFLHRRWQPAAMFRRVLSHAATTVFDVKMVEEWREQPPELLAGVGSALHVPLRGGDQAAILVCTHPQRSHFARAHQRLAENFSTLASQALLNAERQQMEAQLFQARKMEALGILAGGIAHDFNNILTPILIHSQMATLEAGSNPALQKSLSQIEQAAERAGKLIHQILDFNRQGKHDPRPIHLGPVIKEAIKFLRATIAPNIEIEYKQKGANDLVAADPTQMLQVVMNLAINAAHAMRKKGGKLTIELGAAAQPAPLPPEAANQPGWLQLTVTDNGPGIAAANLNRIFDPFFTTKAKGEGSGMGLAVAQGIISKHGGTIRAYSEPGQGACFEILLPEITGPTQAGEEQVSFPAMPGGSEKILFVDDELPVIKAFVPMLERLGYRVSTAVNGEDALRLIARQPLKYDLLITDYNMPGINGEELAARAVKLNPQLPVILCTGFAGPLSEAHRHGRNIAAWMTKPFRMSEFAVTIRQALATEKK
ncbi:ATP-binding protein [Desulfurivibrio sp. D14AmB]|uniref:hybrid sensor histidine kinase/response regulator n=1 Tax=Desulfurivibrio sp. D14AmB TaxID=3374370 RepID=UPI00376F2ED8